MDWNQLFANSGFTGLLGTLVGALAGICGTVWSTVVVQKRETRRKLVELAYQAAMKNRDVEIQLIKDTGGSAIIGPLESFLVPFLAINHTLMKKETFDSITASQLAKHVSEVVQAHQTEVNKRTTVQLPDFKESEK